MKVLLLASEVVPKVQKQPVDVLTAQPTWEREQPIQAANSLEPYPAQEKFLKLIEAYVGVQDSLVEQLHPKLLMN